MLIARYVKCKSAAVLTRSIELRTSKGEKMSEHRFEKNLEDILIWSFGPDYKNIRVTDEDVIEFSFDEGYCILRRNNSECSG